MRKGLMVIFAGLDAGVVQSQGIVHAREMAALGIVDFEIWCFAFSRKMYSDSLARLDALRKLSGRSIRVLRGVRPSFPFSIFINSVILWLNVKKRRPEFELIHARGEYATAVCSYLKRVVPFRLVWDSRGDPVTEYIYRRYVSKRPVMKLAHALLRYQLGYMQRMIRLANSGCDMAIFINDELKERLGKQLGDKPFRIIPSAASHELFYFDEELRKRMRARLGYSDGDRVIIYTGILKRYGTFPECVKLFRRLRDRDGKFRLLILTPDIEYAKKELERLPGDSYRLLTVGIEEVNAYLNAADYALMILPGDPSYTVCSPVKFAEYSLAGLPVIMSDSVPAYYALAAANDNLCEYRNGDVALPEKADRGEIAESYRGILSKAAAEGKYREIYVP